MSSCRATNAKAMPTRPHPAYACSMGGALDRAQLRVAALGGDRGSGHGREEWERRYYGRELAEIERRKL